MYIQMYVQAALSDVIRVLHIVHVTVLSTRQVGIGLTNHKNMKLKTVMEK